MSSQKTGLTSAAPSISFSRTRKAGTGDGHHLINRSEEPAVYLEIGTRAPNEVAEYSDIDMVARKEGGRFVFTRKNGEPYP